MKKFLDLGRQPLANGFLTREQFDKEYFYNLEVGFDVDTTLVSLMNPVDPPLMFNKDYKYVSSGSKTMQDHFKNAADLIDHSGENDILEIGSNDGVFIKNFLPKNHIPRRKLVAVEPCSNFAQKTRDLGVFTYNKFWNRDLAHEIVSNHGHFDIVYSANCMCHIPDILGALSSVKDVLRKDGVFVFEDPSLASMLINGSYDQLYDEHVHVFSITAIHRIARSIGMRIQRVERLSTHGGSNRVTEHLEIEKFLGIDKLETYELFAKRVEESKTRLVQIITEQRGDLVGRTDNSILSYGATSKSTTIFNYCKLGSLIDAVIDNTPDKIGLYTPGSHIPVISDKSKDTINNANAIFLGAWNFMDVIMSKEKDFRGKWITHVPFARII
jgi:SAM-dependent methyltransferase